MRVMGLAAVALLAAAGAVTGQEGVVAIKAAKVYTVSGEVLAPGVVVVRDGRIAEVRKGTAVPAGATVVETAVVIPGLIDASASIEGGADAQRTIAPDVRAIDGYDVFSVDRRQLAGGITTACIAPGSRRLVSGQCAIVKTAGPRESRVLRDSHGLRVTLGDAPKNPPAILEAPLPASSDKPIKPVQRQYPTTRMGQYAALRKAIADAKAAKGRDAKAVEALLEAVAGRRPLVAVAHTCDDIIKAILFADEVGAKLVLVDAEEAARAVDLIAARRIPVVLAMPRRAETADVGEGRQDLGAAAALVKAGVPFALHAAEDDVRDLLLLAAYAVRNGLDEKDALRAITLGPAEILDITERVGAIEKGKDADLVLLDGDPLSGTAVVQRVMVGGTFVYERRESDSTTYSTAGADATKAKKALTAVTGARLLTVTQGVIADGLILIEDGKIAYVGRAKPIPAGATVIDAAGLTIAPGLIDAHSALGMRATQNEVAEAQRRPQISLPANTVNPASDYVRLDDPVFAEAARAGVTAILLAPEQGGVCSLIKLGTKAEVIRDVAAVKTTIGGGTAGHDAFKQFLDRARKYHDEWEAFEKAPKEAPAPKPAESAPPAAADAITGTWKGTIEMEGMGRASEFTAELKLAGKEVTGTIQGQGAPAPQAIKGTFENGELKVEQEQQGAKVTIVLKIASDAGTGSIEVAFGGRTMKGKVEAKRVASGATTGGAAQDGPAKAQPRRDEQLDAWRKVFRREIPVLAVARDIPAIENATKLLKEADLDYILVGADQADYLTNTTAQRGGAVAIGPDFLRDDRGATANLAEALASSGIQIVFTTWTSGSRDLPLYVVRALRYGLDAGEGLKSVTASPARLLKADARIGALERGRDADLVFYSGDPFNLTSQVRRVMISGRIVYEKK